MMAKMKVSSNQAELLQLGRDVKNFDVAVWNRNKRAIVKRANLLKFTQNSELLEILSRTIGSELVYVSPGDVIWGIGDCKKADGYYTENWLGTNLLGYVLMGVRRELLGDRLTVHENVLVDIFLKEADVVAGISVMDVDGVDVIRFGFRRVAGKISIVEDGIVITMGESGIWIVNNELGVYHTILNIRELIL